MDRIPIVAIGVVCIILVAGCTTADTRSTTSPPNVETTTTPTFSPTENSPDTTTQTTTVIQSESVPFYIQNKFNSTQNLDVIVNNSSSEIYNNSVVLNSNDKKYITSLSSSEEGGYTVIVSNKNDSFKKEITITYGVLEERVIINESGEFEYWEITN